VGMISISYTIICSQLIYAVIIFKINFLNGLQGVYNKLQALRPENQSAVHRTSYYSGDGNNSSAYNIFKEDV
jgi:hypothetical protein